MCRKMFLYLVFLILIFTNYAFSQEFTNYQIWEEASAGNFFGVGARAMGMGGAQIATANDASALVYNPACLAKIKRIEFSGGMTHQRLKNETGFTGRFQPSSPYFANESIIQSNTRFSSANIVLPVPTYRGGLVFALGVNRMKSFDRAFHSVFVDPSAGITYLDASIIETGGINMWSLGGAMDLSPSISVGATVNYWDGEDDVLQEYYLGPINKLDYEIWEKNHYLDSYSGWNAKLGFLVQPNKFLSVGGVIDFPTKFSINQEYSFYYDSLNVPGSEYIEDYTVLGAYDLTHPYSFGGGAALAFKYVTFEGDIYYSDWAQMSGKGVDEKLIKENYQEVLRWHLGAEFVMPELSTKLRIGYYEDPIPFKSVYLEKDRRYLTFGAGFLIDQVLTLDVAWNHGFYEFRDGTSQFIKESYATDKIFVSLAYRL
jgi:long-subunit fatty acid transport protein